MRSAVAAAVTLLGASSLALSGCETAPKADDQELFSRQARTTTMWFENRVKSLATQIEKSGGYIVFPDVAQWGIVFGGGKFGRGALCRPDGTQIGWAAVNTGSVGLQVGAQGYKMLVVLESEAVVSAFRQNQLSGSVSAVAVAGEVAATGAGAFNNGVIIYQGANKGAMAGVNVGLDYLRYQPMESGDPKRDLRF